MCSADWCSYLVCTASHNASVISGWCHKNEVFVSNPSCIPLTMYCLPNLDWLTERWNLIKSFFLLPYNILMLLLYPMPRGISRFTESKGRLYWAFLSANFRGVIVSSCDFMVSDHRGILCSISAPESYSFSPYWTKTPTRLGPFCAWRETANLPLLHMQKCNLPVDSDTYNNCY